MVATVRGLCHDPVNRGPRHLEVGMVEGLGQTQGLRVTMHLAPGSMIPSMVVTARLMSAGVTGASDARTWRSRNRSVRETS